KLLETRIGNRGAGYVWIRQDAVHVDEDGARVDAEGAGGGIGLDARGVVDLAVVRDQQPQVIAERVGKLDVVGVEIGVVAVVGPGPVLALGNDVEGNRREWIANGILRIGAGGVGG